MRRALLLGSSVTLLALSQLSCGSNNPVAVPAQPGQTPTAAPAPSPVAVPFPVPVPVPIPFPVPVPMPHSRWIEAHEEVRCGSSCHDQNVDFSVFPDGSYIVRMGDEASRGRITSQELSRVDALSSSLADRDLSQPMNCFQSTQDPNASETFDSLGLTDGVRYPIYFAVPSQNFICVNDGTDAAQAYHREMQSLTSRYAAFTSPSPSPTPTPTPLPPSPSPSPSM